MAPGISGAILAGTTALYVLFNAAENTNNVDGPWLAPRWQRAIDRIHDALSTFSPLPGEWRAYEDQPLSCEHLRFRMREYARLAMEVRRSVDALGSGPQSLRTSVELSRLLARMAISLENYTAPMGEILATIPTLAENAEWIIVRYDSMVEVAPLRGVQAYGSTFSLQGDKLQIKVVAPLHARCKASDVEVYVFDGCVANDFFSSSTCTIPKSAWQVVAVNLPSPVARGVWGSSR
jgi:hypothetical protein